MTSLLVKTVDLKRIRTIDPTSDHHKVISFEEKKSGLSGFIAFHRKRGDLFIGGTRFFPYPNEETALDDVLRLSKSMTAKCIIAGLPYGGAKAVIIGDPLVIKNSHLLDAYAEVIESLNGSFRTGEDVGMTEDDVQHLLKKSRFFIGKSITAGDPSPYAALSTFLSIKEIVKLHLLKPDLVDTVVAVKGLGKVGKELVRLLVQDGAKVIAADKDNTATDYIVQKYPKVSIVSPTEISTIICDVFAPCAMGNEVREDNVEKFNTKIICGGANNQLANQSLVNALSRNGILFVPDFLANAGGLIDVADELNDMGYNKERVIGYIKKLPELLSNFYITANNRNTTLSEEIELFIRDELKS